MRRLESGIRNRVTVGPKLLLTDTTRWSTGARLAIALSKAGCQVSAVCPDHHPFGHARVMRRIFPYSAVRPLESLESAIAKSKPDMIVPCDERGVRHLHELFSRTRGETEPRSGIAALIERSLGSPDSYPIVSSRYDLLKIAAEEGICVPDTRRVNGIADLRSWQAEQAFPLVVLKADCTYGGSGVAIIHNLKEAHEALLRMNELYRGTRVLKRLIINRDPFWLRPWWQRHRPTVVAQAYIEGRPANCAVVCWNGRVLAGSSVDVISSAGPTGPASVVRLVTSPEMMFAAEVIARRLNLSGFFGLDFVIEHKTRTAYLIEMNPRCTTLCHLQLGRGRDMVGALWAQLAGEPLQERPAATEDGMIAYFPQAWTSNDEHLHSSFRDIPHDEPELVHELLRPWPDRTLLYRLGTALTAPRTQKS